MQKSSRRSSAPQHSAPQPTATSVPEASGPSGSTLKRRRGEEGRNKLPEGTYSITHVGVEGEPVAPRDACAKFRNSCGFLVKEHVPITVTDWRLLPEETKELLWEKLQTTIRFPTGTEEAAKQNALKTMGKSFRGWKSELNKEFVKKKLVPYSKYGKITPEQWAEFIRQKTTPEAIKLGESFKHLAKKNKHHHHLGSSGYAPKIPEWRRQEEEAARAGKPNPLEGCDERSRNWVYARSQRTESGDLAFSSQEIMEVTQTIQGLAKEGSLEPDRENDLLTKALGNKEHSGRTRGIGSKVGWKHGFPEAAGYRSRDRYKKTLEEQIQEHVKFQFEKMWNEKEQEKAAERMVIEQPTSSPGFRSSVGSTHADSQKYPVDEITDATSCILHVPVGKGDFTVEAATGQAIPGRVFHYQDIPAGYAKVQVDSVQPNFMKYKLDISAPEDIEILEEAIGSFILWPRRDIILRRQKSQSPASRLSQRPAPSPRSSPPRASPPQAPSPRASPPQAPSPRASPPRASPPQAHPSPEHHRRVPKMIAQFKKTDLTDPMKTWLLSSSKPKASSAQESQAKGTSSKETGKAISTSQIDFWPTPEVPEKYEHGKPFLPLWKLDEGPWEMKKFHEWYMKACRVGLSMITVFVPAIVFLSGDNYILLDFKDLHALFRLEKLDVNLISVWCM